LGNVWATETDGNPAARASVDRKAARRVSILKLLQQ
jgi:hypothetical protein